MEAGFTKCQILTTYLSPIQAYCQWQQCGVKLCDFIMYIIYSFHSFASFILYKFILKLYLLFCHNSLSPISIFLHRLVSDKLTHNTHTGCNCQYNVNVNAVFLSKDNVVGTLWLKAVCASLAPTVGLNFTVTISLRDCDLFKVCGI